MDEEAIFAIVRKNVLTVMPGLAPTDITPDRSLKDLGANSIDRVEVATYSMEDLRVKIPPQELVAAANLGDLVRVLHSHLLKQ
jgi:polyketide biosynthesis acyl carrier protein